MLNKKNMNTFQTKIFCAIFMFLYIIVPITVPLSFKKYQFSGLILPVLLIGAMVVVGFVLSKSVEKKQVYNRQIYTNPNIIILVMCISFVLELILLFISFIVIF